MLITIYPIRGKKEALLKRIADLGGGISVCDAVYTACRGRALQCVCTEEQADSIEGMEECDLVGREAGN